MSVSYPEVEIWVNVGNRKVKLKSRVLVNEGIVFKEPENFDEAFEKASSYLERLNQIFEELGRTSSIEELLESGASAEAVFLTYSLGYAGRGGETESLFQVLAKFMMDILEDSKEDVRKYVSFFLGRDVEFEVVVEKQQITEGSLRQVLSRAQAICVDGCGHKRKYIAHENNFRGNLKKLSGKHEEVIKKELKSGGFSQKVRKEKVNWRNFEEFENGVVNKVYGELKKKSEAVAKTPETLAKAIIRNSLRAMANDIAGRKVIDYGPWSMRVGKLRRIAGYFDSQALGRIENSGLGKVYRRMKVGEGLEYAVVLSDEDKIPEVRDLTVKSFVLEAGKLEVNYEYEDGSQRASIKMLVPEEKLAEVKRYLQELTSSGITLNYEINDNLIVAGISSKDPKKVYNAVEKLRKLIGGD